MASNAVIEVTDATFAGEIEKHEGLVMVDLWAEWCGPCRMVAPVVEALATEYAGRVKVAKLDVDANPTTAARFQVRSIPTMLFFRDGKIVDSVVGALPKPALAARLERHVGSAAA
jgi:thioredoxin 1